MKTMCLFQRIVLLRLWAQMCWNVCWAQDNPTKWQVWHTKVLINLFKKINGKIKCLCRKEQEWKLFVIHLCTKFNRNKQFVRTEWLQLMETGENQHAALIFLLTVPVRVEVVRHRCSKGLRKHHELLQFAGLNKSTVGPWRRYVLWATV